ncbi:hypothetical protein RFI_37811 [Reticulomyxa filosa]|uniref:TRAF-type domain-containing protein n=1 Tax=Reticulomyxa filosa TaxID=46433 RepID=X6LDN0_RETFI|nr:hypothetical protein RFI_37811 [Reticulomyxa filosa]|eukprot:ETN99658.1 hypothetical protein RFI_37811 [Reticulomyxa filosa]
MEDKKIKIEEKIEDKKGIKTEELVPSSRQLCFNKDWLLRLNSPAAINNFICLICGQISNNPIEINCPQHKNLDGPLIVGEHCLEQFLSANSNLLSSSFAQCLLARRCVSELSVMCPLQFEQDLKAPNQRIKCNFNGKIRELNSHLDNSCSFNQSECWFKPFGCDHNCCKQELEKHLISNVKPHFDLVIKSFDALKRNLELLQGESKQLKLQNQQLKSEMQSKKSKDAEHLTLLKENSVSKFKQNSIYNMHIFVYFVIK